MSDLYWLSQIKTAERSLVGDKIFLLSQFLQSNFPVIPGFVVSSSAFKSFIDSLNNSHYFVGFDINNYEALQEAAKKSRNLILETDFPLEFSSKIFAAAKKLNSSNLILRPSLVLPHDRQAANFGILKSQVCSCELTAIVRGIKEVWADLFSAKSLFYWQKRSIELQEIEMAILIQPFQNTLASGVAEIESSQDNSPILKIQATWDLGYSLQRGEVEPDFYVVNLTNNEIITEKIALKTSAYHLQNNLLKLYLVEKSQQEKAVLEQEKILTLSREVAKIADRQSKLKYYEWVLSKPQADRKDSEFFFTQLNYFSSALNHSFKANIEQTEKILIQGIVASRGTVTAKATACESLSETKIVPGSILITKTVLPQEIPLLKGAAGIITEIGGKTSHGAIIARELGIPAIVAASNAVKILSSADWITIDGDRGLVLAASPQSKPTVSKQNRAIIKHYIDETTDRLVPLATQLMVSISQADSLDVATKLPIDGVGLIRGEFMLLELLSKRSLNEWLQPEYRTETIAYLTQKLTEFNDILGYKPIYYRSIDFNLTDKNKGQSVIGDRGTYSYLKDSTLFELELTALKNVMTTKQSNLKLILPFVRSLTEWEYCRELVKKIGLDRYPNFQLWLMAEVPSTIFLLPEYIAAGVQGIAIGTNDLTQLLLGVDRELESIQQSVSSNSIALERAISQIVQTAKQHNIPCSICLSSHQQSFIDKLVNWGITTISVESHAVRDVYHAIARAEKRLLLDRL